MSTDAGTAKIVRGIYATALQILKEFTLVRRQNVKQKVVMLLVLYSQSCWVAPEGCIVLIYISMI